MIKAPDLHIRLNDRDREQITTKNHVGLTYLRKIAKAFSEMSGGRGSARTKSFTTDTRDALVQTLEGLQGYLHLA